MVPVGRRVGGSAIPVLVRLPLDPIPAGTPARSRAGVPACPGTPGGWAFRDYRIHRGRARRVPFDAPGSNPARDTAAASVRTPLGAPQRRPDPLRVVRVGRGHADSRTGPGHRGGAGPGQPDRQARVGEGLGTEAPPPLLPLEHVSVAGPDVGGQDRQAGQGRPVLCFLEHVARVVGPGREFVEFQCGGVAQGAQVGEKSLVIVALAGRPHSLRLQLGTFPLDTHALQAPFRARISQPGIMGRVQRQPR